MVAIKNINDKMFNLSKPKFIFIILLLNPLWIFTKFFSYLII